MDRLVARIPGRVAAAILGAVVVVGLVVVPASGTAQEAPAASSAALEEKLKDALATNDALKERIKKLEEMLKRDVCADPAAAEALLNARVPTPADRPK